MRSMASYAAAAAFVLPCICSSLLGPVVDTEYGKVEGFTRNTGLFTKNVDVFWGLPFAAPPLLSNRFRPPQPFTEPWAPKVRSAKKRGHVCVQLAMVGNIHMGHEDCLYLDVYRPSGSTQTSKLPVFVWIFGGGFFIGDGYEELIPGGLYDGTNIVKQHEHIVASMNYRLNGLGFFALPELAAENPDGSTGNYGVQDQTAALQWVQRNIANFGGDPTRVTLAGESAGAISVVWHLVSPGSRGLFHSAIIESGTDAFGGYFQKKSNAIEMYDEYVAILGCNVTDRLACLRALPSSRFQNSWGRASKDFFARVFGLPLPKDIPDFGSVLWPLSQFAPVIDGSPSGLPDVPLTLFERGDFAKVPLIVGNNRDGGSYIGLAFPLAFGDISADFHRVVSWMLPNVTDRKKAEQLYGGPDFPNDRVRISRFTRDWMFACSTRDIATRFSQAGLPVYQYVFAFNETGIVEKYLGASHGFELPFVWRKEVELLGTLQGHRKQFETMSDIMSCTWASFVKCRSPKCASDPPHCSSTMKHIPDWPLFNISDGRKYLSLKVNPTVESIKTLAPYGEDEMPGDDRCDFLKDAIQRSGFRHLRKAPLANAIMV